MPRCIGLVIMTIFLDLALLAQPMAARGGDTLPREDLCVLAAQSAANQTSAPLQVLLALTLTETGRSQAGEFHPWPWTLNVDGKGQWFASKEEALDGLSAALSQGAASIDIGCFQLNLQWHGANFTSPEQMIDPIENALYAAQLLSRHAAEQGDWILAAGAYHSRSSDKAAAYLARFKPIYAGLSPAPPSARSSPVRIAEKRRNDFPLLIRGSNGAPGSIVPRFEARRVLIGGP